jgi:hypothetical protein
MCDKWRYTYIFWNVHTGHKYQINNGLLEEMFEDLIDNSNEKFGKVSQMHEDVNDGFAFITGSFTNWEPRRMLKIDELCAILLGETKSLKDPEERKSFSHEIKKTFRTVLKSNSPYENT